MRLILFSILFILTSCSKYKEGDLIDGHDIIPARPPFWEYFTVAGYDKDQDGVRDDIEIWINENITDPNIRKVLKLEAGIWQKFMLINSTEEAVILVRKNLFDITSCNSFVTGYLNDKQGQDLPRPSKLVFNNYWRQKEMERASLFIPSGTYGVESRLLPQLKSCPFKITKLKELLENYQKLGWFKIGNKPQEEKELIEILKGL